MGDVQQYRATKGIPLHMQKSSLTDSVTEVANSMSSEAPISSSQNSMEEDRQSCYICGFVKYQNENAGPSEVQMIRPCFCDISCHHGCLSQHVKKQPACNSCGEKYRFHKYGSFRHFLTRYKCEYGIYFGVFLLLSGLAAYAILYSLMGFSISVLRILLLVVGLVFLCATIFYLTVCLRHTIWYRLPRFKERYSHVTVFSYEPGTIRKPFKFDLPASRRKEQDADLTLGQQLFGYKNSSTWRTASTPLAKEHAAFTFQSP